MGRYIRGWQDLPDWDTRTPEEQDALLSLLGEAEHPDYPAAANPDAETGTRS